MLGAPQGCLHANALILLACQVLVMLGCVWNAVVQRIKGARSAPEDSSIYIQGAHASPPTPFTFAVVVIVSYVDVTCIALSGIRLAVLVTLYPERVRSCRAENRNQ